MNPVRQALYELLAGDSSITDLLSGPGAIYHERAPQTAETPFIIFSKQSGRPAWTFRKPLNFEYWLVKGVDRDGSASVTEDVASAIEELLNGAELTIDGMDHLYLARESDVDYPEADGGETYRHTGASYKLVTNPR